MPYTVIARKWRPQKFDDVVGQQAVTRTLRNALSSGRLAQAFVFAGPRGVGKTTSARILARALNCVKGPTPDPCGVCDACVEIAEGRDMDVLEIDAATHTGIDNVREVIVSGLGILPVRNRYKIFIIDEVHQLSNASWNALLKSLEEPPPHVVFIMATTELDRLLETVLSRVQVYEFRTIGTKAIAEQLRKIVDAEKITAGDDALQLIARDADGSMRDAQSKLDQVIAFTGTTITAEEVATALGLVGRDLLLDTLQAVADEDAAAAFTIAGRAVELGYDLRTVCRELARVVRDLLVVSVDSSRVLDPEIAADSERDRIKALAARFSREDLLRAFDVLTKAEDEIRNASQPRYSLEMALLRWIYLRKLTPIADLLAAPVVASGRVEKPAPPQAPQAPRPLAAAVAQATQKVAQTVQRKAQPPVPEPRAAAPPAGNPKDAFLAEIRKTKGAFYNMYVAQAQKIEMAEDRITFTFSANQRALRDQVEAQRAWLESIAMQSTGRKYSVAAVMAGGAVQGSGESEKAAEKKAALREQAMADGGIQAMLEVFPAEIRDVEEM